MHTGKPICLKCEHVSESERIYGGCSCCRTETFVSNITPAYELPETDGKKATSLKMFPSNSMETYRELSPFKENQPLIGLGVRNTTLAKLPVIGKELGLDLYVKDETRNPAWGHKDRSNVVLINKAMELEVLDAVYVPTENNGASGVVLVAKAGMPCMILIVKGVSRTLETSI